MIVFMVLMGLGCSMIHTNVEKLTVNDVITYLIFGAILFPVMAINRITFLLADRTKNR